MTIFQLTDARFAGDGDLIQSVAAMHDQYMFTAQPLQHVRQGFNQICIEHTQNLPLCIGGIGERAENVE